MLMNVYTRARSAWLIIAAALLATSCSTDEILEVTDPDIINPSDVQSPAGANAVRLGALARFNAATSGGESLLLLGGLFSDEWVNGDSFIARQEIDQRVVTKENTFLTDANRVLHRARLSAEQAVDLIDTYAPATPGYQIGEMYLVQAYVINLIAENYCDGVIFSRVVEGREEYGTPITTQAAFEQALVLATSGLARITGTTANDQRVQHALQITRGRILMNLNRPADALAAVAGVPNSAAYTMQHSLNTQSNNFWSFNNNARRYSVSNSEGTNGMNFATAGDPRVPVCVGGTAACTAIGVTQNRRDDLSQPLHIQMMWPARETPVSIIKGIDARMIEAEAQLRANNPTAALGTLNAARATVTGLTQLADAGTAAARIDQLFRERAFWQFGRGYRVGDLRRLIRQYQRPENTVFPTGQWHKGGTYGTDVNVPVPFAEQNNPVLSGSNETCLNRTA
jgi:starch-binding outer membrane protein, SusD/RagB family